MSIRELDQLGRLDSTRQRVFAYLACGRLYPNYVYFSSKYLFGNTESLMEAMDFLFHNLFDKVIDEVKAKSLSKIVEANIPEPADYETILASSAFDACTAIIETLDFFVDSQIMRVENISTIAIDTVAMYIQDTDRLDPNTNVYFKQKLGNNSLMLKELTVQKGIISYLSKIAHPQYSDIETLVHLQEDNIGSLRLQQQRS